MTSNVTTQSGIEGQELSRHLNALLKIIREHSLSAAESSLRDSSIQHHLAILLIKQFGCNLNGFNQPVCFFIDTENPSTGYDF